MFDAVPVPMLFVSKTEATTITCGLPRGCAIDEKHSDVVEQLRLDVYCSVHLRPLAIEFDSYLVDCDPGRLRRRRAVIAVSYSVYSLMDRLIRAFHAE